MRKLCLLVMLLMVSPSAYATVTSIPAAIERYVPSAQAAGSGRLVYWLWDIYDATLFAPNGKYSENKPFALSLDYLREIEGRDIVEASILEMRRLGYSDEAKLAQWEAQLLKLFPDVTPETRLIGVYQPAGATLFLNGDKEIGQIDDPEFGKQFFGIWLHPNTREPTLQQALLGKAQ